MRILLLGVLVAFSIYIGFRLLPSSYSFILLDCHGATFDDNHQCKTTEDGFASDAAKNGFLDYADYLKITVNPLTKNAYFISRSVVDNTLFNTGFFKDCAYVDRNDWQCFDIDTSNEKSYYAEIDGRLFYEDDEISPFYSMNEESLTGLPLFLFLHNMVGLQEALKIQGAAFSIDNITP
jgi:hypothetical protein